MTSRLDIVRSLVAKANSTEFEGEARVFREKAEQLIKKYGLDRALTGIDGVVAPDFDFRRFMREREEQIRREQRRGPGGRYTATQLYTAAHMKRDGYTFKTIGQRLGIKATGHLAKTLRELGYL